MADTIQKQIINRITAALQDVQGLAGGVHQSRVDPFSKEQSPAINIYALNDTPQQQTIDFTLWNLLVRIAIVVRGVQPDDIANGFRQDVHERIMALGKDNAFDTPGLVQYVYPSNVQFDMQGGDQDIGVVACDYVFQYRTGYLDLTVSG